MALQVCQLEEEGLPRGLEHVVRHHLLAAEAGAGGRVPPDPARGPRPRGEAALRGEGEALRRRGADTSGAGLPWAAPLRALRRGLLVHDRLRVHSEL